MINRDFLLGVCFPAVLLMAGRSALSADPAVERPVARYQWTEEWGVAAQGPVHLREKRVKTTHWVEVRPVGPAGDERRRLQVRFVDVLVDADVPAQKRKTSFDSRKPPPDAAPLDHEVMAARALHGRTLQLKFDPDGDLTEVLGAEEAERGLDALYDRFLRGSEQDLYTRDMERTRVSAAELRNSFADLFCVREAEPADVGRRRERKTEITYTACIPSESWMSRVHVPAVETVEVFSRPEGGVRVERSAELKEIQRGEGDIGGARWTYAPKEARRTVKVQLQPDGTVESMSATKQAVLETTLFLGSGVPIQMTIRHSIELAKQ